VPLLPLHRVLSLMIALNDVVRVTHVSVVSVLPCLSLPTLFSLSDKPAGHLRAAAVSGPWPLAHSEARSTANLQVT